MNTYQIEKNVPRPFRRSLAKGQSKYPFATMEPGDSFFVAADMRRKRHQVVLQSLLSQAINHYRKAHNVTNSFGTSQVEEKGVKGVRVWRLADKEESK